MTVCCCSFAHDQEPLEVSEVLFERDEKRGSDTLYAAGWNAKVRQFMRHAGGSSPLEYLYFVVQVAVGITLHSSAH